MPRRVASVLLLAALPAAAVGRSDRTRDGPRFPFRDFDPSNPDGRLRVVGRFYE